jgi:hypothetical protein
MLIVHVLRVHFVFYLGSVDVACGDGVVEGFVVLKGYWCEVGASLQKVSGLAMIVLHFIMPPMSNQRCSLRTVFFSFHLYYMRACTPRSSTVSRLEETRITTLN